MSAKPQRKRRARFIRAILLVLVVSAGIAWFWFKQPGSGYTVEPGFVAIEKAFHDQRTGFMTEVSGSVVRILTADKNQPRTQEFVIRMANGQSLLVTHDKVAGGEVPVAIGDKVLVRGQYTWTETGGTVQFTQLDPSMKRRHGFVEHRGKRYQ